MDSRECARRVHGYPTLRGSYSIPPVEFTYFDLSSNSYKTLTTPEYALQIDKGDPAVHGRHLRNRQDVRVEQDIRF